jgi:rod shape determining protein RodA
MLRIDRRLLVHFDWVLLASALLVVGCGLVTVLSATRGPDGLMSNVLLRQAMWVSLGLAGLLVVQGFDYHWLDRYAYVLYVGSVGLLVATAALGAFGGGARRWISVGPVAIQPSEFTKLTLVLALARYLHRQIEPGGRLSLRMLIVPAILLALPAVLVLKQPDLGTVIVLVLTTGAVLLLAGLRVRLILALALIVVPAVPSLWQHLKPYQQRRVLTFINPNADPLGAGYHIIQSKIAIGSGMLHGKGFLRGTQNRLNFLPEQHTDFIFSVLAEEWGFIGACVLLGLYAVLLTRCFLVAWRARDSFGALVAFGLTAAIFSQVLVNIAMATGALPVVGITLPFLSYGGSSMLTSLASIGLLLNISTRRFTF